MVPNLDIMALCVVIGMTNMNSQSSEIPSVACTTNSHGCKTQEISIFGKMGKIVISITKLLISVKNP